MNNKETQVYRFIRNALFVMLIGGVPAMDINASARAVKALSGNKIDCSSGEATNPSYNFDLIAVFGAGTYIGGDGEHPNTFQGGRLDAAAAAFVEGLAPKIVLLDGGQEMVAEESIKYLREKVAEFSNDRIEFRKGSIEVVPGSVNTATNARDLEEYMKTHGLKKALGITDEFHAPRASDLDCNYGVNSKIQTVEDFAPKYYPYNIPEIDARNNSLEMKLTRIGEKVKIASLIWDPLALVSTKAKSVVFNSQEK